jgi:ribonuclease PH
MSVTRPSGRLFDELRSLSLEVGVSPYAEGSCLIKMGGTHVLCTASVEERVPSFLKGKGQGWVTAEYGMLPRATSSRTDREAAKGKQSGRTQEIQRLIGRSLRSIVNLKQLGERQIIIDCDVIQADGGTRCAAITGGYLALYQACHRLTKAGKMTTLPITDQIAAVSCGIYKGLSVLDLDYAEDSNAEADSNFVMTAKGGCVEIQATAEKDPISTDQFNELFALATQGIKILTNAQIEIILKGVL